MLALFSVPPGTFNILMAGLAPALYAPASLGYLLMKMITEVTHVKFLCVVSESRLVNGVIKFFVQKLYDLPCS